MIVVIKYMIICMKCLYNFYSENMFDMGIDKLYKCIFNFIFVLYCFSLVVVREGNVFCLKFLLI